MLIVHNRFTFNCALNKQKPVTRTLHIRYILIFLIAPVDQEPISCSKQLPSSASIAEFFGYI